MQYLRRTPEVLHLRLGYGFAGARTSSSPVHDARAWVAVAELEWSASDEPQAVLRKLKQLQASVRADQPKVEEARLMLRVLPDSHPDSDAWPVTVALQVLPVLCVALKMELQRVSGTAAPAALDVILGEGCALEGVRTLRLGEGFLPFLLQCAPSWSALTALHLQCCGLTALPEAVLSELPQLTDLHLDGNKLTALPSLRPLAPRLRLLSADRNLLTALPPHLAACTALQVLSLEHNRLVRPIVDLRPLGATLRELRLGGNPLDYLPEMSHCTVLRRLSLANVRIVADSGSGGVEVSECGEESSGGAGEADELGAASLLSRVSTVVGRSGAGDFSAFYALIFRFSSCQLPLIAAAIAVLAAEPVQAEALAAAEGGVQQLLSMVLSDNADVVRCACTTLALLAESPAQASKLLAARAVERLLALLRSPLPAAQCAALRVIAALAWASNTAAVQLSGAGELLQRVCALAASEDTGAAVCALEALGNIALAPDAAAQLRAAPGIAALLAQQACGATQQSQQPWSVAAPELVRRAATRALAILGENDLVAAATGRLRCLAPRRGLRILSMDGGGMRGLATVRLLRALEAHTGRRIHELFDLVCGTSTGGVLAVALGVHRHSLDTCEALYRHLGTQVFSTQGAAAGSREEASWQARLGALYGTASSRVRVAVSGCKHDAATFERLMREACAFAGAGSPEEREPTLIDTAYRGGPAVFTVATLMSVTPAVPFIFRNYQHDPSVSCRRGEEQEGLLEGTAAAASKAPQCKPRPLGSCKHRLWHAVRASSAAPYYLADFLHGGLRWQDGAVVANNPSLLALQEASQRWPGTPVDCLVSLGSGSTPVKPRDASSISRYIDAGAVLVEAACDVQRTDDALQLLCPAAGVSYFRFSPTDERCCVELDELEEGPLQRLCEATREYVRREQPRFAACAQALLVDLPPPSRAAAEPEVAPPPSLVEATAVARAARLAEEAAEAQVAARDAAAHSDAAQPPAHASCESPPVLHGAGVRRQLGASARSPSLAILDAPRPGAHPHGAATHVLACLAAAAQRDVDVERVDLSEPALTAPESAAAIAHALRRCATLHWAGHVMACCDSAAAQPCAEAGLVTSWRSDVHSVAEPGDAGAAFLASVSPLPDGADGDGDGDAEQQQQQQQQQHAPTLRALCGLGRAFEAGGVLHTPLGHASHGQGVFSALFSRQLPRLLCSAEEVRLGTAGAWRGGVLVCARGAQAQHVAAAALDAGAAAVLLPGADARAPAEEALSAFFQAFYLALFEQEPEGDDPQQQRGDAARAAERVARAAACGVAAAPCCRGFRVLALREGHLVALRPSLDATVAHAQRVAHPALAALQQQQQHGVPPLTPATPRSVLLSPRSPGDLALGTPRGGVAATPGTPSRRLNVW